MRRNIAISLIVVSVFACVGIYYFPYHREAERRIVSFLNSKGLSHVRAHVSSLDTRHIALSSLAFDKEKMHVAMRDLSVNTKNFPYRELLQGQMQHLTGDWQIQSVALNGIPYELPMLSAGGTVAFNQDQPVIIGSIADSKTLHGAQFTYTQDALIIHNAQMPWQGGVVSIKNTRIALNEHTPLTVTLHIQTVPLQSILQLIAGAEATATGNVSGSVALTFYPQGDIRINDGMLSASGDNRLHVPPSAIPGDNKQVNMVREMLSDFHYTHVSLTSSTGKNKKLAILLRLEGNNPQYFDGRDVKLNVNFTGDLLDLVQQTMMPLANPRQYLEQAK